MIDVILADSLSHIAAALPTTAAAGDSGSAVPWLLLLLATLPGVVLVFAGAWRPGRVLGPDRAEPFGLLAQFLAIPFFGFFSYMLIISAYNARVHHQPAGSIDDAFLTTIPPLLAFGLMVAGDGALGGREGLQRLGVHPRQIPRGVYLGIIGALIAIPLVLWVSILTDAVYEHWHYIHPMEHELLPAMSQGPQWTRIAIFLGAVIGAPLFEETLFRAHLQTLLRSAFTSLSARWAAPIPPATDDAGTPGKVLQYARPIRPRIRAWHSWAAIIITSVLFSMVHPLWMRPPIFVFSLCLGYAYERTGLLWSTTTMHALFNGIETYLYFHLR